MTLPTIFSRRIGLLLTLLATASTIVAELPNRPPVVPISATGGLQLSLSTNAFRIDPAAVPVVPTTSRPDKLPPRSLVASVTLVNRSGSDIEFNFADPLAADRKFDFRVLNAEGDEVWKSASVAVDQGAGTPALLPKRSKWTSTLTVPLQVGGVNFPGGRYTLEATIAGEPRVGASVLFEIVASLPPVVVPPNTGITGQVLRSPNILLSPNPTLIGPAVLPVPVAGATVWIQEIFPDNVRMSRPPFTWTGQSDLNGRFKANTPPGRFSVRASTVGGNPLAVTPGNQIQPLPISGTSFLTLLPTTTGAVQTTVSIGSYSEVKVYVGGGFPLREDTGLTGKVFKPASTAVYPGAFITVEEDRSMSGGAFIWLRPEFRWTGLSDQNGEFKVIAPAGFYRITAGPGPGAPLPVLHLGSLPALQGSAVATVINGSFTDVSIHLGVHAPGRGELIYSVHELTFQYIPTFVAPSMIELTARGIVSSGGWSNPTLRYRRTTLDGAMEFDFVAEPPTGPSTQALVPVTATALTTVPDNFREVRVYSATNSLSRSAWGL